MTAKRILSRLFYVGLGLLMGIPVGVSLYLAWAGSGPRLPLWLTPTPAYLEAPWERIEPVPLPPCDKSKKDCPLFEQPKKVVTHYTPEPGVLGLLSVAGIALVLVRSQRS